MPYIGTSSGAACLKELLTDVKERCETGQFKDKTVLFCWEHKNIPYIVARFGLTDRGITWGSNPDSEVGSSIPQVMTESVSLLQSCATASLFSSAGGKYYNHSHGEQHVMYVCHQWHASVHLCCTSISSWRQKACCVQVDDHDDFTSIWVFKPDEKSFKVYQQFSITVNVGNANNPYTLVPPPGGYGEEEFFAAIR